MANKILIGSRYYPFSYKAHPLNLPGWPDLHLAKSQGLPSLQDQLEIKRVFWGLPIVESVNLQIWLQWCNHYHHLSSVLQRLLSPQLAPIHQYVSLVAEKSSPRRAFSPKVRMDDEYRWRRYQVWHDFPGLKNTHSKDAVSFCYYNIYAFNIQGSYNTQVDEGTYLKLERTQGGLQERGNDGDGDEDDHDHDHNNDDDDLSWERTQGGLQERGSDFPLLQSSSDPSSAGSKAGHSPSRVWKITNILSFKKVTLLASLTVPQAAIMGSKWKLRHKEVRKHYW